MRELGDTGQVDLSVAQNVLIKSIFISAKQFGFASTSRIVGLVRDWEDSEYPDISISSDANSMSESAKSTADRQVALIPQMRDLLNNDSVAASEALQAVRSKLASNSYSADSVLFELWQNADDAYVELDRMKNSSHPTDLRTVGIHIDESGFTLVHYGRPINQYSMPGFTGECGIRLGYHRDLVKMLQLSASDKMAGEGTVTGKFGLGFKSVFLVCDQPRVLSGQIAFDVIAGMYPTELDEAGREQILRSLEVLSFSEDKCTAIQLLWRSELTTTERSSSYRRLLALLDILLVFSRRAKTCHLHMDGIVHGISSAYGIEL